MRGYYKINIPTEKNLKELINKIENSIDFEYRNKIGTIEIDHKYYGDKINERKFKIWRKHDISQGLFDIGLTNSFIIEIDDKKLTLQLSRNWVFRIIVYLTISLIAFASIHELTNLPIWPTGLGLLTLFLFHHLISSLTDQSIIEGFQKIIR